MKAIGVTRYLPITNPESLLDLNLPEPKPEGREILVRVHAVSVNPVDTKVRAPKDTVESAPRVLGWDAAGVVEAVGPEATLFKAGDGVYYAGSIERPGCNSELHAVDERIVGSKPKSLDFAEAAALPLTALTAYEGLFERLGIDSSGRHAGASLLVIGGAGGVGSIATQLARLAGLQVIATASRDESRAFCERMGASHLIDHRKSLPEQIRALGLLHVDYILNTADTAGHWEAMAEVIRPLGRICSIVESKTPVDLTRLMRKSVSFSWELMFTRSLFKTEDMIRQHELLNEVAAWVDKGRLRSTMTERVSPINAANLRAAHEKLESGRMIGKLVLSGWN
jgi:zinc-binding alcohol dehydrogenase family protein